MGFGEGHGFEPCPSEQQRRLGFSPRGQFVLQARTFQLSFRIQKLEGQTRSPSRVGRNRRRARGIFP